VREAVGPIATPVKVIRVSGKPVVHASRADLASLARKGELEFVLRLLSS